MGLLEGGLGCLKNLGTLKPETDADARCHSDRAGDDIGLTLCGGSRLRTQSRDSVGIEIGSPGLPDSIDDIAFSILPSTSQAANDRAHQAFPTAPRQSIVARKGILPESGVSVSELHSVNLARIAPSRNSF